MMKIIPLQRTFELSLPITSTLILYMFHFHLKKHLNIPIALTNVLSKFSIIVVEGSNSTSGKSVLNTG